MRARVVVPVLVAASLLLSGCATDAFSEPQTVEDELPAGVGGDYDDVRYAGDHDGASVYLAQRAEGPDTCAVIVRGDAWVGGCSPRGAGGVSDEAGVEVLYDRAGVADAEGWTRLDPYVLVR